MGKKWIVGMLAALIVAYLGLWPFDSLDAGEIYMVETLLISGEDGKINVYTRDVSAEGGTVNEAIKNLAERTPGQLFLRQTKRVIFCGGAEERIDICTMPRELPIGVIIYRSNQEPEKLQEDYDEMERRLGAKERREEQLPTLAKLQNRALEKTEGESVA